MPDLDKWTTVMHLFLLPSDLENTPFCCRLQESRCDILNHSLRSSENWCKKMMSWKSKRNIKIMVLFRGIWTHCHLHLSSKHVCYLLFFMAMKLGYWIITTCIVLPLSKRGLKWPIYFSNVLLLDPLVGGSGFWRGNWQLGYGGRCQLFDMM